MKKNIVVAASGSGSNFKALIDAVQNGTLNASISGLIASREDIGAATFARQAGIPVYVLKSTTGETAPLLGTQLLEVLQRFEADLFVLAGFLRKIPDEVVEAYRDRILNIHPSLLPRYGGKGYFGIRVHQAVLNAGETKSGCTIHLVNEAYDEGRVLAQKVVEVLPADEPADLAARVLREEHKLYAPTIQQYLESLTD